MILTFVVVSILFTVSLIFQTNPIPSFFPPGWGWRSPLSQWSWIWASPVSWIAVPPYISSPSLTWRFAYAAWYFCKHYFSSTFYWLLQSNKRVSKAFIRKLPPTSLSPVLSSEDTQIALSAAIAIFSLAEENRGCDLAWISAMSSSRKLHLRLGRRLTWFRAVDNS